MKKGWREAGSGTHLGRAYLPTCGQRSHPGSHRLRNATACKVKACGQQVPHQLSSGHGQVPVHTLVHTYQLAGYQAQGPTCARPGPGLFSNAQGLPGPGLQGSWKSKATSWSHKSPSGKPKQAELRGGRAGGGLRAHPQGVGHGPLAYTLPRGPFPLPGLCPTQAWPGEDRQNQGGRLRILETCLD